MHSKTYFIFPLGIAAVLLATLMGMGRLLQNENGPVRSITYLPGDADENGAWIVLDSLPEPANTFEAYFHSKKRFVNDERFSRGDIQCSRLQSNGKVLRIISLEGAGHVIKEDPRFRNSHDSTVLIVGGKTKKLLTVLLPGNISDLKPEIKSFNSGRTHVISVGTRNILVHSGVDGKWSVPDFGLSSSSSYLVAVWKTENLGVDKGSRSLLERVASKTIWLGDTIVSNHQDFPGKQGDVFVWTRGGNVSPVNLATSATGDGKTAGLKSRHYSAREGLMDPGNYDWKCDRDKLSLLGKRRQSYFLPSDLEFRLRKEPGKWEPMLHAYRDETSKLKDFETYPENRAPFEVAYAAFVARMDHDDFLKSWVIGALAHLDSAKLTSDSFTELRANYGWWYLTAYDLILPLLTERENEGIKKHLKEYLQPVVNSSPYLAINATSLVLKSTIGLAGILLGNPQWIAMMVNHLDWYLDFGIRDGICYEGNHYLGVGFAYIPTFMDALNWADIGGVNFYSDERFQRLVASLLIQTSPTGDYPCFEDCSHSPALNELIASSGAGFRKSGSGAAGGIKSDLISMCRWIETNTGISPDHTWLPDFRLYFDYEAAPLPPSSERLRRWNGALSYYKSPAFINPGGGSIILRNGWGRGSELLAMSAKDYDQAHTHMDELSFELWALGENWISNPEYGNFGAKDHAWLSTTKASNSLIINGHGQVNQKGCRISSVVVSDGIQHVGVDGSGLYRHPERFILRRMWLVAAFAIGLMCCSTLAAVWLFKNPLPSPCLLPRGRPMEEAARKMPLVLKNMTRPYLGRADIRKLCSILLQEGSRNHPGKIHAVGALAQSLMMGVTVSGASFYLSWVITPFVTIYAEDERYHWMRFFIDGAWFGHIMAFFLGMSLVAINYKLLDLFLPKITGMDAATKKIIRDAMRLSYADTSSMALVAIAAFATLATSKANIQYSLLATNPDPWNFQSHFISYFSKPLIFLILLLIAKMVIQFAASRKLAAILLFMSGSKKWYYYGLLGSWIAISLKKAAWITVLLLGFLLLLWASCRMTAEALTVYK